MIVFSKLVRGLVRTRGDRSQTRTALRLEPLEPRLLLSNGFPAFSPIAPDGSLAYSSDLLDSLDAPGESDQHTLSVDAGQTIAIRATPQSDLLRVTVQAFDPAANPMRWLAV